MDKILQTRIEEIEPIHVNKHKDYEYRVRPLVPRGGAGQCSVHAYEILPGKSNYPYHWHTLKEESFYIVSGVGELRTPEGTRTVSAGDFLFFPTGEKGAHKLTNVSENEDLVYLDFDTEVPLDACFYPDSGKVGIYGSGIMQIYRTSSQVEYYDGE